ncbi:MFS transporter [Oscillibacter sp. MSJ-2]|uniref:MFS transporter n=1 Tax=Dysosmobacter acutus TaxID=2841504 RepID=A0ABS6FC59_9FIRM|nr:MFS transporter [Dysosmobacter acutus]MBU5627874.1 MFS transporter [Dysosmobacter acutus]
MKLNGKRTVLVGFAFLSICAFWQMYNNVIPLILTNTFRMNEMWSGIIMAADNVLALFLLPLFGALSDRSRFAMGRRRPFLLFGTGAAVALMLLLPVLDNSYSAAPAPWKTAAFIAVLASLLVAMGTYRSPAVALMPDVTPKPLRSKGNAVINLMGALGGILYLLVASALYRGDAEADHVDYLPLFAVVAGVMVVSVAIVTLFVDERRIGREMARWEAEHPEQGQESQARTGQALPKEVKRSLGFLLCSIALWFTGYNAIETWFTTYANREWGMSLGDASVCLTVATAGAIVAYLPIGALASRVGRKRTILMGAVLLACCFFAGFLYTLAYGRFSPVLYGLFALVGLAWAAINVNSLPMVVEMCSGGDIGRFTGYYYTFSMAAQTITPIAAGWLLRNVGYTALFPYAAAFVAGSVVTMLFVRHGDSRAEVKRGLEAFDAGD